MLYQNKTNGNYYLLNESDNLGYDCYSFTKDKEQIDGFFPFSADLCCCDTEEERKAELAFIDRWDNQMTEENRINYCLEEMGTSLDECILIEDNELEDELFYSC